MRSPVAQFLLLAFKFIKVYRRRRTPRPPSDLSPLLIALYRSGTVWFMRCVASTVLNKFTYVVSSIVWLVSYRGSETYKSDMISRHCGSCCDEYLCQRTPHSSCRSVSLRNTVSAAPELRLLLQMASRLPGHLRAFYKLLGRFSDFLNCFLFPREHAFYSTFTIPTHTCIRCTAAT